MGNIVAQNVVNYMVEEDLENFMFTFDLGIQ